MSLRDRGRAGQTFEVDEAVRRVLSRWSKEKGTPIGLSNLEAGLRRLDPQQRRQLVERLAEVSLGLLFVIERLEAEAALDG